MEENNNLNEEETESKNSENETELLPEETTYELQENNDEVEDKDEDEESDEKAIKVSACSRQVRNILSWVWTILLAFLIAIIINSYVIRASEVYGRSMNPTLVEGDVVFISRLPYIINSPKHNDIVVFDSTLARRSFFTEIKESLKYNLITQKIFRVENTDKYWIKRVIGVPGDVISAKDGKLYRNGKLLEESYINYNDPNPIRYFDFSVTVEDGKIFVMGDNRNNSEDSRMIGQVPINDVLGKVVIGVD